MHHNKKLPISPFLIFLRKAALENHLQFSGAHIWTRRHKTVSMWHIDLIQLLECGGNRETGRQRVPLPAGCAHWARARAVFQVLLIVEYSNPLGSLVTQGTGHLGIAVVAPWLTFSLEAFPKALCQQYQQVTGSYQQGTAMRPFLLSSPTCPSLSLSPSWAPRPQSSQVLTSPPTLDFLAPSPSPGPALAPQ